MKLKEKFSKAKEKAGKVKTFISEHRVEIGLGMSVIGSAIIGAAAERFYEDRKYGGIRRIDGFTHINKDGEEDSWIFTVSPTVRQMKEMGDTPNRIIEFESKEDYENACEKYTKKVIK